MRKFSHPGENCLVGNGGKAWLTGQNHGVVCQHFAEFFFREVEHDFFDHARFMDEDLPRCAVRLLQKQDAGHAVQALDALVRPEGRGGGDKIVVDHSSAGEIMLNDRRDLALGLFGLVLKMQVGKVSSSHKVFLSVSLPPSARQTPPTRGEVALAPEGERWPRRAGERELRHCPKYFGLPQGSLPHPLRREPPRRGGQGD